MSKYIEVSHNQRGIPTEYANRIDLDTALKERSMDGFYGKKEKSLEQKELHRHIVKRAYKVGAQQAKKEIDSGKTFNKDDMSKL